MVEGRETQRLVREGHTTEQSKQISNPGLNGDTATNVQLLVFITTSITQQREGLSSQLLQQQLEDQRIERVSRPGRVRLGVHYTTTIFIEEFGVKEFKQGCHPYPRNERRRSNHGVAPVDRP
jgi:hypothetical protein